MAKQTRFVTPYKYAQLCGVSTSAINQRIERGVLEVVEMEQLDGSLKRFVDTEKFPPSKLREYPTEIKQPKKE